MIGYDKSCYFKQDASKALPRYPSDQNARENWPSPEHISTSDTDHKCDKCTEGCEQKFVAIASGPNSLTALCGSMEPKYEVIALRRCGNGSQQCQYWYQRGWLHHPHYAKPFGPKKTWLARDTFQVPIVRVAIQNEIPIVQVTIHNEMIKDDQRIICFFSMMFHCTCYEVATSQFSISTEAPIFRLKPQVRDGLSTAKL